MRRRPFTVALLSVTALAGCRRADPDAPPAVAYGESPCAECGMIVSDERFGVATVIEGERGTETLLFDDFNCQFGYERDRSDLVIVRRWARDHGTRAWLDPASARFVLARSLRTPMGSHLAAFRDDAAAADFAARQQGTVMDLAGVRDALSAP